MNKMNKSVAILCFTFVCILTVAPKASAAPESCEKVRRACENAGYYPGGGGERRGVQSDCVAPILEEGKVIDDVVIDKQTVKECQSQPHPCMQIESKCEAAGFVVGAHRPGNGLQPDCIDPILAGKPVADIKIDSKTIHACNAMKTDKSSL
jgi:hypothetical protein